ncbi:hypothetical protein M378DRAFT_538144 [Amanita muscaria Koide BX008]|uniref:Aquaporin n=1 Tax=Amanita muscaria (strain Koide BX008) TaxID=946122 RepID=A0A0C2X7Q0_AMAMK|nr:hypothetical protein M378DRAFT_538144 [Amanita muscaria Koide BX008]
MPSHVSFDERPSGNGWSGFRTTIREPFAEFLGTTILTLIGLGVNCQSALSSNTQVASAPKGDWATVSLGWSAGAALGFWVASGISGGHINPAVTLALATFRGFPWKRVPAYIIAQLLGGIAGGALVYANYIQAIDIVEGGRTIRTLNTASLFAIYPLEYMTGFSAFFSEMLCTSILMIGILAMLDKENAGPPKGLAPLVVFITVMAISMALGMQTGFGMNPAHDLGPRIVTSIVGYGGAVFNFRSQYWFWGEIIAPILGAQAGTLIYDALIYTGKESVVNKSFFDTKPIVDTEAPVDTYHTKPSEVDTKLSESSVAKEIAMFGDSHSEHKWPGRNSIILTLERHE